MNNIEDVRPPAKETPEPRRLQPARVPRYRRRMTVITSCIIGFLLIAGLAVILLVPRAPSLPKNLKGQVKFTTFLPTKLPQGYIVDTSSYSYQNGVLTFEMKTPDGIPLLISEQPQPTSFDMSTFYKGLKNTQSTSTPYGTAQAGTFLKNKAGTMVASGTWVFVSGAPNTDVNQILTVFSNLKKAD